MSGLISGKEALIALANGEEVEFSNSGYDRWYLIESYENYSLGEFFDGKLSFRLKPRTISLNGIEVPAPFEPKDGDIYYFINSSNLKGYGFNKFSNDGDDECLTFYGAWRTEEEIKKVVAALRSVFNVKG